MEIKGGASHGGGQHRSMTGRVEGSSGWAPGPEPEPKDTGLSSLATAVRCQGRGQARPQMALNQHSALLHHKQVWGQS